MVPKRNESEVTTLDAQKDKRRGKGSRKRGEVEKFVGKGQKVIKENIEVFRKKQLFFVFHEQPFVSLMAVDTLQHVSSSHFISQQDFNVSSVQDSAALRRAKHIRVHRRCVVGGFSVRCMMRRMLPPPCS